MSVLIDDEPPKKRRKGKGETVETVRAIPTLSRSGMDFYDSTLAQKPKGTRQKKEKKELSKDEETIKRLKVRTTGPFLETESLTVQFRCSLWSSPAASARSGQRNSKTSIDLPRRSNASNQS